VFHPITGSLIAVFLMLALAGVVGRVTSFNSHGQFNYNTSTGKARTAAPNKCRGAAFYESPCAPDREDAAQRRQWAEDQDLKAQRQMARWTLIMGVVAIAGIFLSAIGIYLVFGTLVATRRATVATREIGENQTKAYVNIAKITIREIGAGDTHLHTEAVLFVTNTGNTPARRVKISTHCRFYSQGFSALQKDWSSETDIVNDRMYDRDVVDLPPDSDGVPVPFVLPQITEEYIHEKKLNMLASHWIVISGRVEYSTVFRKRYLTEFVFKGYVPFEGMPLMQRDSARVATYKEVGEDEED
jgi:hypothetical protein